MTDRTDTIRAMWRDQSPHARTFVVAALLSDAANLRRSSAQTAFYHAQQSVALAKAELNEVEADAIEAIQAVDTDLELAEAMTLAAELLKVIR